MATMLLTSRILCFLFFWQTLGLITAHVDSAAEDNEKVESNVLTTDSGRPIGDKWNSLTAGPRGPMLIQDVVFLEELTHFVRERIPDRVVHGKGNGAFGYFEVTDDITRFTKAKVFSEIGKQTRVAVRFSLTIGEVGSADSIRDIRGYAVKFYTEEGDFNLVGVHLPVFPIRDAILFPSFIHAISRNPVSNLKDPNSFWDFVSLVPESTASMTLLHADIGIPKAYRFMDGHSINPYKLINAAGETFYCKFNYLTNQGIQTLFSDDAVKLAGMDPDSAGRDLFQAIENEEYPSWTLYIQVMSEEESRNQPFNPFDATKEWPEDEFPQIRVGKLVLNENPTNYFADIEQLAFCPSRLVPGIEPSPDKVLQGRQFAYTSAQSYRLGTNFNQIPVNCPHHSPVRNFERNGFMNVNGNHGGAPNYYPNSFGGPQEIPSALETPFEVCGTATRHNSSNDDNFSQAKIYYERLEEEEKNRLVQNIAETLSMAHDFIQERQVGNFNKVHPEFAEKLTQGLANAKTAGGQLQSNFPESVSSITPLKRSSTTVIRQGGEATFARRNFKIGGNYA